VATADIAPHYQATAAWRASLQQVFEGLLRGQRKRPAGTRELVSGVAVDVSKLQTVTISGAAPHDCEQRPRFSRKWWDELEMHLLPLLKLRGAID